jgi:hypothetical protein
MDVRVLLAGDGHVVLAARQGVARFVSFVPRVEVSTEADAAHKPEINGVVIRAIGRRGVTIRFTRGALTLSAAKLLHFLGTKIIWAPVFGAERSMAVPVASQ